MSKRSKKKWKLRNAAPRPARAGGAHSETPLQRLGYTAAGAAASAFVGAFLTKEGWAPKTVAGALSALGAGLTWKGDGPTIQSFGSGTMSSAGGQLVLMLMDDHHDKAPASIVKKPANADALPPGALEAALERARARLAMTSGQS